MKIVHICNNYVGTKVHANQIENISIDKSVYQNVIVPVYDKNHIGINEIEKDNIEINYIYVNVKFLKFFPLIKLLYITYIIFANFKEIIKSADVIYSHTLWTNGLPCYLASIIYRKKFFITIRSTDVGSFIKFLPHYRPLMKLIIRKASNVIFLTPIYKKRVVNSYPWLFKGISSIYIPNGIDEYWFTKVNNKSKQNQFIFVGRFTKNKNFKTVYKSFMKFYDLNRSYKLLVIGGSESELKHILKVDKLPGCIVVKGKITNIEELSDLYLTSRALVLPSINETFGLVYLEALSRKCPVILSKGEAIDGLFPPCESISTVDSYNVEHIYDALLKYGNDDFEFDFDDDELVSKYSWSSISDKIFNTIK
ncbi:glycosyltransferase [Vibrio tritonius]|uniref:glycosyltransferase n=1 Tax=Vibrio tritonius TaxID=1435069 RepID=UPI000838B598|nr:glycosyltransferase [Vibrio tritonius]